jgi:hypothetical protein
MSSEEVTVDHAQSMVMNPQVVVDQTRSMAANTKKAAEDQTESTTTNPEGSTVDHSRSTVMNSEEEDAVDQTESTARKRKETNTAEPNLTSKKELEVISLSNDPNVNEPISISSLCYNTQVASAANIIPQVGISSAVRITKFSSLLQHPSSLYYNKIIPLWNFIHGGPISVIIIPLWNFVHGGPTLVIIITSQNFIHGRHNKFSSLLQHPSSL